MLGWLFDLATESDIATITKNLKLLAYQQKQLAKGVNKQTDEITSYIRSADNRFFNIISLVNFINIKLSNVTDELDRRSYQYHITALQASAFLTKVFHQTISFKTYLQSFYASVQVLASEKLPIDLIKIFCNSLNYMKELEWYILFFLPAGM